MRALVATTSAVPALDYGCVCLMIFDGDNFLAWPGLDHRSGLGTSVRERFYVIEDSTDLLSIKLAEFGCDGWREKIRRGRGIINHLILF